MHTLYDLLAWYPSWDHYVADNPARNDSRTVSLGDGWFKRGRPRRFKATWLEATGEAIVIDPVEGHIEVIALIETEAELERRCFGRISPENQARDASYRWLVFQLQFQSGLRDINPHLEAARHHRQNAA